MSDEKEKERENMEFNIYYLNFSKVYEISMMINNVIRSSIQREKTDSHERSKRRGASFNAGVGSKEYLANIKSGISSESNNKDITSSKWVESLDVITTKSILLREIICKCIPFSTFNECKEENLLKIDKLSLSILDEETLRGILVLRKDALKGLSIEGFEVNNLISSMLQDYSYILKGVFDDEEKEEEAVILKIPMEIENEFENKYNVYDLLIGHLSLIGVYKGTVSEDFIKTNTFNYFANFDAKQQQPEKKVFKSSIVQSGMSESKLSSTQSNSCTKFHFIDIIALVQDVQFDEKHKDIEEKVGTLQHLWNELLNFFSRSGGKK